jgi:hypothetical protein
LRNCNLKNTGWRLAAGGWRRAGRRPRARFVEIKEDYQLVAVSGAAGGAEHRWETALAADATELMPTFRISEMQFIQPALGAAGCSAHCPQLVVFRDL